MAMTLRLDASDEALLREVAERTNHTMTDVVALSVRFYRDALVAQDEQADLAQRAERRAAHRKAIDESMTRNAELLERLAK
ncbi:hypothetical protein [Cellulomonas sp. Leaf334]|uniref:hypothetical protein n=1 Tax=Cellulomonas sp. Leaf334 TaxID=1736339 RepID=UPI0006FECA88|nr:hypothetical protein [Cellulomonas sp. Leaf334]KQR08287.1 hypothetical protein ASF78_18500 [Cellulomonas sp. Leaf334]